MPYLILLLMLFAMIGVFMLRHHGKTPRQATADEIEYQKGMFKLTLIWAKFIFMLLILVLAMMALVAIYIKIT